MVRWLVWMAFLGLVGVSTAAPRTSITNELGSFLGKRGVTMDPDGYERAEEGGDATSTGGMADFSP